MKRLLLLALSVLCISNFSMAQTADAVVKVDNIKFTNLNDDWVQMEVQLRTSRNTLPDAKNPRFVDAIKVSGYFAYENKKSEAGFDFYKAEVEVISIEQGKQRNVYFFMPGEVAKRDDLRKIPQYYFVSLEVGGVIMPMSNNAYSSKLNEQSIMSMKARADAESAVNDFILKPSYNAPLSYLNDKMDKLAPLLIREPKL